MTKTTKIIIGIIVAIIIIGGIWYGLIKQSKEEGVIKIGVILPLTGETAIWGENIKSGIDLAVEEVSKKYNIVFNVIYEDSQCDPAKAASAVQKLINIDKVLAIIGEACSSATLAAAPIAERNAVVLITPFAAADKISDAGDFIFRIYPSNTQLAKGVIKVLNQLNKNKIAIMYVNNDFGVGLKDNVVRAMPDRIVISEAHEQKDTDFRTNLLKVKVTNPDAVFLATYYTDGALILKQAKEMKIQTLFIGPDVFDDPKVVEIAKEAANGIIFATVKPNAGPEFNEFSNLYQEKYQKGPPFLADFGFDSLMVIANALKNGHKTGTEIKDFLYTLKDYKGASNQISFDKNGDLIDPALTIKTIKNGQFVPYE